MASERVQKILAQTGIASRRKAEEWIVEGLVTINGKRAQLGDKADLEADSIKVRGKLLRQKESPIYLAFYKPRGVLSTLSDPENRPTLMDFLSKVKSRVFPVGRLDFNSEGLILLTNDGAAAEKLQKMEGLPRVYHVKVRGRPAPEQITRLGKGARIGNRLIKPHSVRLAEELSSKIRVEAVFTDSGAIDVKGLFESRGFLVEAIRRTAIGQITLRGMIPGQYRLLKSSQIEALLNQPELGLKQLDSDGTPHPLTGGFEYQSGAANTREKEREATRKARTGEAPQITPVGSKTPLKTPAKTPVSPRTNDRISGTLRRKDQGGDSGIRSKPRTPAARSNERPERSERAAWPKKTKSGGGVGAIRVRRKET